MAEGFAKFAHHQDLVLEQVEAEAVAVAVAVAEVEVEVEVGFQMV